MLRAKSLSRVPRSSIALILSLSSKHDGMTGLPVALKLDLILVEHFRYEDRLDPFSYIVFQ